jgi:hypothetical protein
MVGFSHPACAYTLLLKHFEREPSLKLGLPQHEGGSQRADPLRAGVRAAELVTLARLRVVPVGRAAEGKPRHTPEREEAAGIAPAVASVRGASVAPFGTCIGVAARVDCRCGRVAGRATRDRKGKDQRNRDSPVLEQSLQSRRHRPPVLLEVLSRLRVGLGCALASESRRRCGTRWPATAAVRAARRSRSNPVQASNWTRGR